MSKRTAIGCMVLAVVAGAANAQATNTPATPTGTVIATQPVYTQSMRALQESAQRLRESIQALAQKPPGPERTVALDQARSALLRTQEAMVHLPPQDRVVGTMSSTADYDASVKKLMSAADSLRRAVQEMAAQPAGARRNQAIRDANRALLDTQVAMANAYDLTAFPARTATMGAAPMHCVQLEDMRACR
ncbi:hypothetical protein H8N03_14035 [Ramlibacter sp. USB13]|uniref:Secreted protein n=1 Tax=Ramlibacter cellulosilyticus TaxID=2764187 RepID=A0A923MQQ3_9BURK|nr:hypothetical protein [Ramlibacter cellulosilyticus]MBC5784067.1 hypothetical protein [Ramlibacter cellulosilyticus]